MIEIVRWLLVPCCTAAAFYAALYFSLFALYFSAFPRSLAEPTAAFLMGALPVLAGASVAPRYRFTTACALVVLGTIPIAVLLTRDLAGALLGGGLATLYVGWWFNASRTRRSTRLVAALAAIACAAFVALAYAQYRDWPPRRAALTPELEHALGDRARSVSAFYRYDLGGFIDRQQAWRLDATPDAIDAVIATLKLESTAHVSSRFWTHPPHYWPRTLPAQAQAFQSLHFNADERGIDGDHYFLLHDRVSGRAYLWVKNNF